MAEIYTWLKTPDKCLSNGMLFGINKERMRQVKEMKDTDIFSFDINRLIFTASYTHFLIQIF